ncbi:MAG TPA: Hpt domain-containing protein [Steroidobacteraceae bacterium]|nr:Hpt domain-containing protein [Steroidobacteraceae bacterium]
MTRFGPGYAQELERLERQFRRQLARDAQQLLELESALTIGEDRRAALAAARQLAHRLRGSAATFGEVEIGSMAGLLEEEAFGALQLDSRALDLAAVGPSRHLLRELCILMGKLTSGLLSSALSD